MIALLLSLLSFAVGPILFAALRQRKAVYGFLDGFVLVGVAGLVLADVIPRSFREIGDGGWLVLALAAAGFVLPFFLERRLAIFPFSPTNFFQGLMMLGLFFHQTLDGMALVEVPSDRGSLSLQLAIILHQLPKGFLLWSLVQPAAGKRLAALLVGGIGAATIAGYFLASNLSGFLETRSMWLFQAFVAGGLLHVIVHHVPGERTAIYQRGMAFWSGLGALFSLIALLGLHRTHMDEPPAAAGFEDRFLDLFLESAPTILLGLVAAGCLHAFLPKAVLRWFHGRGRISQALRGIAVGIPLPICSCGVAPVFLGLVKKGVPTAAAIAFLIATPEIGLDSVFLSWKLLGWKITLIRLGMAFFIALAVGLTVSRLIERRSDAASIDRIPLPENPSPPPQGKTRALAAIRFGGADLVDEIGIWLIAGIAVAALIAPLAEPEWVKRISGELDVLAFSLLGLPLYVCASGATPLAAVLLDKGISAGAVLVFLINGPATNLTTFGILKQTHGIASALLFAAAMLVFSVIFGLAVNLVFPGAAGTAPPLMLESHNWLEWCSFGVLLLLFAHSILRRGPRGFLAPLGELSSGGPVPSASTPKEAPPGGPHRHAHNHRHDGTR